MADKDIINIIGEYIRSLLSKGLVLSKVILYGSQARGDNHDESDIDLMLISPVFDLNNDQYASMLWLTAADIDFRIEPIAIGEKRFNEDRFSPLIGIAKKEGIEIEF